MYAKKESLASENEMSVSKLDFHRMKAFIQKKKKKKKGKSRYMNTLGFT